MEIIESDYKNYLIYNGLLSKDTSYGIDLKNNKAKYYIIKNNDMFYADFVVFGDNELSLNECDYKNTKLIDIILSKIDYITCYLLDDKKIKDNYKVLSYEEILVNRLKLKKIKFTKK